KGGLREDDRAQQRRFLLMRSEGQTEPDDEPLVGVELDLIDVDRREKALRQLGPLEPHLMRGGTFGIVVPELPFRRLEAARRDHLEQARAEPVPGSQIEKESGLAFG